MSTTSNRKIFRAKYTFLLATLSLLPGVGVAATDSASITVTGKVLANTCTLDKAASTLSPILPDISDRDIKGVGTVGGEKDIDIVLKDCGAAVKEVLITVTGTKDGGSDDFAFKNTSQSDPSSGVGLYFYQTQSGTDKFKPDGSTPKTYAINPSEDNTLKMRASYVGLGDTVTAGNFQSTVTMTIDYK
ncbi:fimbrial protein [Serratia inhibens]|uniref:fimbrial protein n=1 Tax=Serratia inhibens TaxID=2338073 RepID=UPI0008098E41|nr:fimbrial protein [Serratia inhibens]ANS44766.1 Laminin-binding fimbrial subunit ElfA [Serratia inhibens PRI-2C]